MWDISGTYLHLQEFVICVQIQQDGDSGALVTLYITTVSRINLFCYGVRVRQIVSLICFVAGGVMKVVLKKYATASLIRVDTLIWPQRCQQVAQDPSWIWVTSMDPWVQTRAEQSAKWAWKRVSSHILLLYLLFCFIIVAPASMELQKYGVVLNLSQTITRSVLNGMHEQACPY